uniref:D-aminoacyl-tRNA deacylase n=1 Tax=Leersia perrieri TaxID=77586 RepID=A0A0D9X6W9_9ORYZ
MESITLLPVTAELSLLFLPNNKRSILPNQNQSFVDNYAKNLSSQACSQNGQKVLLGIGGGHYAPRHMDIVTKDGVWVGHLLSGYSLPMEEPKQMNGKNGADVGGMWKHSMKVSYEATKAAFPGGEIIAHIDQK